MTIAPAANFRDRIHPDTRKNLNHEILLHHYSPAASGFLPSCRTRCSQG
ncbi:hypothetical protein F7734_53585 [Scytonema sp. UIC 10036]|nr:hypothetical protein [Scytonema sp. UIC 10036]MUH00641.1 hypothetical protein [Scytonema sp. UIC 10036]